jgi:hypothetical protein
VKSEAFSFGAVKALVEATNFLVEVSNTGG